MALIFGPQDVADLAHEGFTEVWQSRAEDLALANVLAPVAPSQKMNGTWDVFLTDTDTLIALEEAERSPGAAPKTINRTAVIGPTFQLVHRAFRTPVTFEEWNGEWPNQRKSRSAGEFLARKLGENTLARVVYHYRSINIHTGVYDGTLNYYNDASTQIVDVSGTDATDCWNESGSNPITQIEDQKTIAMRNWPVAPNVIVMSDVVNQYMRLTDEYQALYATTRDRQEEGDVHDRVAELRKIVVPTRLRNSSGNRVNVMGNDVWIGYLPETYTDDDYFGFAIQPSLTSRPADTWPMGEQNVWSTSGGEIEIRVYPDGDAGKRLFNVEASAGHTNVLVPWQDGKCQQGVLLRNVIPSALA